MTREEIEQLNAVEPYCFESDREEQWYNVGLKHGLEIADNNPKSPWTSVNDDLIMCNNKQITREEAIRVAVDVLKKLITNDGGKLKMVDKDWLWKPIDGNVYYNSVNILRDFKQQLIKNLLK